MAEYGPYGETHKEAQAWDRLFVRPRMRSPRGTDSVSGLMFDAATCPNMVSHARSVSPRARRVFDSSNVEALLADPRTGPKRQLSVKASRPCDKLGTDMGDLLRGQYASKSPSRRPSRPTLFDSTNVAQTLTNAAYMSDCGPPVGRALTVAEQEAKKRPHAYHASAGAHPSNALNGIGHSNTPASPGYTNARGDRSPSRSSARAGWNTSTRSPGRFDAPPPYTHVPNGGGGIGAGNSRGGAYLTAVPVRRAASERSARSESGAYAPPRTPDRHGATGGRGVSGGRGRDGWNDGASDVSGAVRDVPRTPTGSDFGGRRPQPHVSESESGWDVLRSDDGQRSGRSGADARRASDVGGGARGYGGGREAASVAGDDQLRPVPVAVLRSDDVRNPRYVDPDSAATSSRLAYRSGREGYSLSPRRVPYPTAGVLAGAVGNTQRTGGRAGSPSHRGTEKAGGGIGGGDDGRAPPPPYVPRQSSQYRAPGVPGAAGGDGGYGGYSRSPARGAPRDAFDTSRVLHRSPSRDLVAVDRGQHTPLPAGAGGFGNEVGRMVAAGQGTGGSRPAKWQRQNDGLVGQARTPHARGTHFDILGQTAGAVALEREAAIAVGALPGRRSRSAQPLANSPYRYL